MKEQKQLDLKITVELDPITATKARTCRFIAYSATSKFHGIKFDKRQRKLLQPMQGYDNNTPTNTTQANPISRDSNLVTDLTNSLSLQETNLPAKGPKFSLSPGVNNTQFEILTLRFAD